MISIEDYLADSFDDVMQPFYESDGYTTRHAKNTTSIAEFKEMLPEEFRAQFDQITDSISNQYAYVASKAFEYGAKNGMALREQIINSQVNNS